METPVDSWAREALTALSAQGLLRQLQALHSPQGPVISIASEAYINFSSNDYLGLANAAWLREAAHGALERYGVGAGASRLTTGHFEAHQSLEETLAAFKSTEAAVVFSSGYAANVGTLAALLAPGDVVFSDALNHASIIDGCRLSRATTVIYPHRDVAALEALVARHTGRRRLVVTDAVFSMDGTRAPLAALAALCRREGMGLMVDEAHATGIFGTRGAGLCEAVGVTPDVDMGTLSKGLGCVGGYVAGTAALCALLMHKARSLFFSTALPPAMCAAAEAALRRLSGDAAALRAPLWRNIGIFARGLRDLGLPAAEDSPIFSIVLGAPKRALAASEMLQARHFYVRAIRPPTVPVGTSRLRVTLSAAHEVHHVEGLLAALGEVLRALPDACPVR